ncbi:ABC transporter ATP-binding protein [Crenobacter caeni]|uniref:Spermidine/putrescine import ATP-binding protein PotA n=1 Tax=Crenobacter caeni TaxID=2705474 RepID=A0A6B2KN30_9NEIS|nr:ABC transporter ATP-binding protein [Crenobacter caeni]NDV11574.1 ABC transporter ATP-binding protein [Crenobacter caeni]
MSETQSGDALVSFRGVQKSYDGESLIVKHLDLDIRRGEFLTLLGPSGSGKTTCLMMLAGFETPSHGEIWLDGKLLNRVPPHKRDIGMVFQNYALFPHMTVGENLAYPLKLRKLSAGEIAERVKKALGMVRLDALAHRYPGQLSGGQQQRVALARALVFEPKLVLMDEPLGALDKQLREHMQLEIKHIHERLGVTVVYVTHDQSEALTMSDRVAVFKDGIIQQIDTPNALYEAPSNAFVASFIGENNRLDGEVVSVDGEQCSVRLGDGSLVRAQRAGAEAARPTAMSIRPERVRLGALAAPCETRLSARLIEQIYLGDHVRLRLALGPTQGFMVKVPISDVDTAWQAGQTLDVGWMVKDLRALAPQDA